MISPATLYAFLGKRASTIKTCVQLLQHRPKLSILELGTTRSFRSGHIEVDDFDSNPEHWDWGAGCFTAAIKILLPEARLTSVDPNGDALRVSARIADFIGAEVAFHKLDSTTYLGQTSDVYDLIYMDHAEAGQNDACAILHRKDAEIIIRKSLVKRDGLILVDDVKQRFNKGMYSIPYLVESGYVLLSHDAYQCVLRRD